MGKTYRRDSDQKRTWKDDRRQTARAHAKNDRRHQALAPRHRDILA